MSNRALQQFLPSGELTIANVWAGLAERFNEPLSSEAAAKLFASPMALAWLALLALGVCMVGSASVALSGGYAAKHIIYLVMALVACAMVMVIPLDIAKNLHKLALLLCVLVCLAVLVPGVGHEVNGARRWIRLGAFSLQASEVAKLGVLVYLAGYLERFGHLLGDRSLNLLKPLLLVGIVAFLLLLEPDFGGAVVLATTTCGLLFVAGARLRHFFLLVLVGAGLVAALILTQPYRMARITAFADPWQEAFGSGYQLTQALIAFGRGEVFGLGLGEGIQKLYYLPEAHNDFILAVIGEELGIVGVLLVLVLFAVLVGGVLQRGHRHLQAERRFAGYLSYGVGLIFALQFLINVGVNTGVLPTKGLTLPFVSYGGNSLIVSCVLMGLVFRAELEAAHAKPIAGRRGRGRQPNG